MRMICLVFVTALLTNLQFMTPDHAAAAKESVTIELNADLLKRALAQNVDLASILEAQLQAQLGSSAAAAPTAYLPFLTGAIDNFEAMIFAPLAITANTPTAEVRAVCQTMNTNMDQLIADAETRNSMPLPTSLEEAKKLDEYIQGRFQAFQGRAAQVDKQMQTSVKIMQAKCADLARDGKASQKAMQTIFAGYGPVGFCRALQKKPQGQWSMDDSQQFMKFCVGVK